MGNFINRILGKKETQIVEEIEPVRRVKREAKKKEELIASCMLKALGKKLP